MPDTSESRLLLVDDDDVLRETLRLILEHAGFDVVSAGNVQDALKLMAANSFDVLVSDLHMPNDGDGLTVVSAMRHSNPKAVTIIFSAHPQMNAAAEAILAQTDDIFVKPQAPGDLVDMIRAKMKSGTHPPRVVATIAAILEEDTQLTIKDWLSRVNAAGHILPVPLDERKRTDHLPQLFRDLVLRLSKPLPLGSRALASSAAAEHGRLRRQQGYTAAMMVEESRMLQVSIFQTLQNNLHRVNFSHLLLAVMAIADEVDSQLAQAMAAYVTESEVDALSDLA
jgi:DNA-binding response OmpR family regulator